MLSKLNVTAFKGSGGSVFRVDDFFNAVQVSHTGIRDVNVPAEDIICQSCCLLRCRNVSI